MHKIVIPDIHLNLDKLNLILNDPTCLEAQEIIFLGDYFDSFDHSHRVEDMCDFLNSNLENDRYTFLLGNHDVHYFCKVAVYTCSGWSETNQSTINRYLSRDFMKKVQPLKYEKIHNRNFLFSHAGLHPNLAPIHFDELLTTFEVQNFFDSMNQSIMDNMFTSIYDCRLGMGQDRGGLAKVGGVTWMDWDSFIPIDNLNQIVGHSTYTKPQFKYGDNSVNINIDTNLKNYLLIDMNSEDDYLILVP